MSLATTMRLCLGSGVVCCWLLVAMWPRHHDPWVLGVGIIGGLFYGWLVLLTYPRRRRNPERPASRT